MFTEERHNQIMRLITAKKYVTVEELCGQLFVSAATIRRDLSYMEKAGYLKRSHGGAALVESLSGELSDTVRELEHVREKRALAELAGSFLKSGLTIFMDSSSTARAVIPFLKPYTNLAVITNGLKNAMLLSQATDAKVFVPSGVLSLRSYALMGIDTRDYLAGMNAQLAFVSCGGVDLSSGITDPSPEQSALKRVMLQNAKIRVLLCDHSKFGAVYLCKTCGFEGLDYIVTDSPPPEEYQQAAAKAGCEILSAAP